MMFGNVAPAPFSVTCAAAGAAASRVARASDVIRFMSSLVLERELHLEKGTLAARVLQRRCATFEREQVHVAEHPDVGLDLIRETGDDARLLVVRRVRMGIHDIDAPDSRGFTAAEAIDAERAQDAPADRGVFGRHELTRQRHLLRLIRESAEEAIAVRAAGRLADPGVAGESQSADWACVVRGGQAHGDPSRDRKSTRLNSSHVKISYAVFCLKKK